MHDFIHGTEEEKQKRRSQFKFWNKWFVVPLYRINLLPLFGFGRIFLLLYHIGRKSGNRYITPVEYRKRDGKFLVFASRGTRTDWYQNIRTNPDKTVIKIGFRKHQALIHVPDYGERLEIMKWYVESYSRAAKMLFGWNQYEDQVTDDLLRDVAEFIQILEFSLHP